MCGLQSKEKKMNKWKSVICIVAIVFFAATVSQGAVLASEDFEAGNTMQTKANGGATVSRIVDPTNPDNMVMYLTTRTNGVDHVDGTASLYADQWFPETTMVTFSFDIYFKGGQGNPNDFNDGIFSRFGTVTAQGWKTDPPDPVVNVTELQSNHP